MEGQARARFTYISFAALLFPYSTASLSLSFLLRSLNHRGLPFSHVGLWAFNATASRARVPFDIFAVAGRRGL